MHRRSLRAAIIAATIVVAACGASADPAPSTGSPQGEPTIPPQTTTTSATEETTTSRVTTSTAGERETGTTGPGRPMAPDFTLELGTGGTYTLSEGEKPVYLVFWAEW